MSAESKVLLIIIFITYALPLLALYLANKLQKKYHKLILITLPIRIILFLYFTFRIFVDLSGSLNGGSSLLFLGLAVTTIWAIIKIEKTKVFNKATFVKKKTSEISNINGIEENSLRATSQNTKNREQPKDANIYNKYIFAAVALFLTLGSALLFTEMASTYSTLDNEEVAESSEIAIAPESTETDAIINVRMETSMGEVLLELYPERAPETVRNFLSYTNAGTYDGTLFHRIISGFMNQGGGYTPDYLKVETQRPISNEAYNGLKNLRGTIAMARTSAPHSATSQFFINTANNTMLDHTGKNMIGWGYAVFGKVVSGIEVIDNMAAVQTGSAGPFSQDAPLTPVIIHKMTVVETTETDSGQ